MARVKPRYQQEDLSPRLEEAADRVLREAGVRAPNAPRNLPSREQLEEMRRMKAQVKPDLDRRLARFKAENRRK
jgi:hypothetical protein